MGECCYVNADFDLSLRSANAGSVPAQLERQVNELSVQALLGARTGEAALLREPVADAFLEHLHSVGAAVPRVSIYPEIDRSLTLVPFGWNAEAIELNARQRQPSEHPPLEVVKRVNSRRFQLELEQEEGHPIDRRGDVESLLAGSAGEWLFKGEHGTSGLANRRLRSPALSDADRRFVDDQLSGGNRAVIEVWRDRLRDFSAVFSVPFDATTMRIHETMGTRDGALIGAIFDPGVASEWTSQLHRTADRVAAALGDAGYFGPVCMDAFSWSDGDSVHFRPLVDLNCRRSISERAHLMWRQLAPDRTLYYRFFNRRKLRLPEAFPEALSLVGSECYDPRTRRGVLLASPTHFIKIAVGFFGIDRSDVFEQERRFRAALER